MALDSFASSWTGMKGSGVFRFSSMDGLSFKKFAPDSPKRAWNIVGDGLTFGGECRNRVCAHYKEEVSPCVTGSNRDGFGTFDMGKETCFCKCPSCNKQVIGNITCYLRKCKWSYDGVVVHSQETERTSLVGSYRHKIGNGVAAGVGGYYKFTEGLVHWRYLRFEIFPLDDMDSDIFDPISDDATDPDDENDEDGENDADDDNDKRTTL